MSARETLNRWVEAMQILCGHDDNPGPERRAGYEETRRKMLDAAYAELLAEAKIEVVAWLVKKAAEGTPVGELASKVDRGAVRIFLGTGHYRDAMDAHRAKVLAEAADFFEQRRLARADTVTDFDRGRRAAEGCVVEELRELAATGEKATAAAATATPDFFQPGHTYAREHHASTIRFLVRYIDDSPEGIPYRVAFGWKTEDGDVCASPFDSDDMDGWTDVTEAGDGRG